MLTPLKREEFDRYIDHIYALALDPARSGYPTYTDGIKTKADLDHWRLLLYMPSGVPAGAIQARKDSEMVEIFGIFFPAAYDAKAYRALVTSALNGAKADGATAMVFFNDRESQADSLALGFRCVGEYMCYQTEV